jgi:hypothetical protein
MVKVPILWGFWDFRGFCGGENVVRLWWNAWWMWCFDIHFFWCRKIRQTFEVYFVVGFEDDRAANQEFARMR